MSRTGLRALYAVAILLSLVNAYWLVGFIAHGSVQYGDFVGYYGEAVVGRTQGWGQIYDLGRLRDAETAAWPGMYWYAEQYSNNYTPVVAWLVTPFTLLPFRGALWLWWLLNIGATVVAAQLISPPGWRWRLLLLLAGFGLWTLLVALESGNVTPLILGALVGVWELDRRGHQRWSGALLGLAIAIKPQDAILVAPALLVAGRARVFTTACLVTTGLALASVLAIGQVGLLAFAQQIGWVSGWHSLQRGTIEGLVGAGNQLWAARLAVVAAALLAGRTGPGREAAIVGGAIGSLLASNHVNALDYGSLGLIVWLLMTRPPLPLLAAPMWAASGLAYFWHLPAVVFGAALLVALAVLGFKSRAPLPGPETDLADARPAARAGSTERAVASAGEPPERPRRLPARFRSSSRPRR